MRSKTLRAERAKLLNDAGVIANKEGFTAEDQAEFDRLFAEAARLMAQIERIESAAVMQAELATQVAVRADLTGVSADHAAAQIADAKDLEKRLFKAFMLGGASNISDYLSESDMAIMQARMKAARTAGPQNAASIGTNTAGGYVVAPDFMRELLIAQKAFGGMRGVARAFSTDTGVDLPWPTMDDTSNVATIVGENTAGVAGTDLVFGSKTLKAWMYRSGFLALSLEILQDSAFDFDSLVRDALAMRFARGQNTHFTNGDGTTQPQGVITGAALGRTGTTGQTLTVIFDDLMELEHSVDPAYRSGARFMMHDTSFKVIKKLKDSQSRPLFVAGYTVGAPDTLLGYPITINQDMPVMAANAKSILFGNFQNYMIRDVMGLRVTRLNERFAENGQVAFIAFQRTDGRLTSAAAPIKWYANSAS